MLRQKRLKKNCTWSLTLISSSSFLEHLRAAMTASAGPSAVISSSSLAREANRSLLTSRSNWTPCKTKEKQNIHATSVIKCQIKRVQEIFWQENTRHNSVDDSRKTGGAWHFPSAINFWMAKTLLIAIENLFLPQFTSTLKRHSITALNSSTDNWRREGASNRCTVQ